MVTSPLPPSTPGLAPGSGRRSPAARRGPRTSRLLLALVAVAHALLALAQPVLIGGYLDGRFDWVAAHGVNGSLLPGAAAVVVAAAGLTWARGGAGWPTAAAVVLWCLEGVQMVLGWTRVLSVHVVLGVVVVGGAVALAAWTCSPAAGRPRRGWWT
ncbi:hypothetical protein [Thalassiella azotivora]